MKLTWIQNYALLVLLRAEKERVSKLCPKGVEANLFSYHLGGLVTAGYIEKCGRGQYRLTTTGQKFAGTFSTATDKTIADIKTVVMLYAKTGEEYLLFRWSRQPHLGQATPLYDRLPLGKSLAAGIASALNDKLGANVPVKFKASAIITIKHNQQIISHMNAHVYQVEVDEAPLPYTSRNGKAFLGDPAREAMAGVGEFLAELESAVEPFESTWSY